MMDIMKTFTATLLIAASVSAQNFEAMDVDSKSVSQRALPNNPSGDYAPAIVDCPASRPVLRNATSLSPNESEWLQKRRTNTIQPMTDLLKKANITDFDVNGFFSSVGNDSSSLPNIAIAVSGGSYRALLNGAGFIAAADNRVAGGNGTGGIGGLLQSATYLAGLSGGGWLVSSIYANNFSTIPTLQAGSPSTDLWRFDRSILEGPTGTGNTFTTEFKYWELVYDQVQDKVKAGFNTSVTDYWGRALSFQLINDATGGPAYTFSSISQTPGFANAQQPMPILVADERSPGTVIISPNSTVFEFNPWEMGSWDPTLYGFAPMEYIGSSFNNGNITSDGQCVRGFDQLGFVLGTSSSLFNAILLRNISTLNIPSDLQHVLTGFEQLLSRNDDDIAKWSPNPFFGYNNDTNPSAEQEDLTLVDGGEDLQNIPLDPLIQPARAVDVIFAVDSSADTANNFPNATALRATYKRSLEAIANGTQFPKIPSAETFINLGLNRRPTAFGCNVTDFNTTSGNSSHIPPIIVYIPNTVYTAYSNTSTYQLSYSLQQRDNLIQNGYNAATMGNGTVDASWPMCVGCFIVSRSLSRTGKEMPRACEACFTSFCWNGTVNETPVTSYNPLPLLELVPGGNATDSHGSNPTTAGGTGGPGNAASGFAGGTSDSLLTLFTMTFGAMIFVMG